MIRDIQFIINCRGVMVKKLAEWNKRCIIHFGTKATTHYMGKYPKIVFSCKGFPLENAIFFLNLLEKLPFFLKRFLISFDCLDEVFFFELREFLLGPGHQNINLLRHMFNHMIEDVCFISFVKHIQAICEEDSILPGYLVVIKRIIKYFFQFGLLQCFH